jgi:ribosomal protein S18 acetylase RimI-like enzyme
MNIDISKIEIRTATDADVELISVLATTTFYEAYFEQDTPGNLAGYIVESFETKSIQDQLDDPEMTFLIAYVDGRAVGYAKLDAGSRHPSNTTDKTIELKRLYAVERVWGKGVGEAMLRQCESFAIELGCETIWLGVWEENERGQRFYKKQGFVRTGTLEFIYGDVVGINDVMEKRLKAR